MLLAEGTRRVDCSNGRGAKGAEIEKRVLAAIKTQLLSPERVALPWTKLARPLRTNPNETHRNAQTRKAAWQKLSGGPTGSSIRWPTVF